VLCIPMCVVPVHEWAAVLVYAVLLLVTLDIMPSCGHRYSSCC
jgi:hypothetical protein